MKLSTGFALALLAAAASVATIPQGAFAGLQSWSVLYLDGSGNPTSYDKAKSVEAYAFDQRGYSLSFGCAPGGGMSISAQAPEGAKADFAGQEVEPSFRISKPGTDLFLGPIGKMTFDGKRYSGSIPEEAVAPLRTKIKNGLVTWTEFGTRTTISLKAQGMERAIAEVNCP